MSISDIIKKLSTPTNKSYYRKNTPYISRSFMESDIFIIFIGDIVNGNTSTNTIAFSIDTSDNNKIDSIFKTEDLITKISEDEMKYLEFDLNEKINEFKDKTFDELCNIVSSSKNIRKYKL